jgi:hypothetical protein
MSTTTGIREPHGMTRAEPTADAAVMVHTLWEHGGSLAELVRRMQQHERRAQGLAREAEALRLELTDILRRMYIGGQPPAASEVSSTLETTRPQACG